MSSTSWPTRFGMMAIVDVVDAGAVWVQQLSLRVRCVVSIVLRFAHTCGLEEFVRHAFVPLRGESGDGDGDQIARPSTGACILSKSQIPRAKLVKDIHNLYEESKRVERTYLVRSCWAVLLLSKVFANSMELPGGGVEGQRARRDGKKREVVR
jgi:hypothetical protein